MDVVAAWLQICNTPVAQMFHIKYVLVYDALHCTGRHDTSSDV